MTTSDWIATSAETLGGVAAAVAAFFAWRAARDALRTARESREALSQAIKPDLLISSVGALGGSEFWDLGVVVANHGSRLAVEVEVVATFTDGTVGRGSALTAPTAAMAGQPHFPVGLSPTPLVPAVLQPSNLNEAQDSFRSVSLYFSDGGSIARWRRDFEPSGASGNVRLVADLAISSATD